MYFKGENLQLDEDLSKYESRGTKPRKTAHLILYSYEGNTLLGNLYKLYEIKS
jgi:hypothetical protein